MGAEREFEGKTVDQALRAASEALGIPVDDLQYDMLEEKREGLTAWSRKLEGLLGRGEGNVVSLHH